MSSNPRVPGRPPSLPASHDRSHPSSPFSGVMYGNPVHNQSFPDPFVLKFSGRYWAYATGIAPDGRCFEVMHSDDLLHWNRLGGAMEPLPGGATHYRAPEVAYINGRFYLYYSVGDEETMEIRVAVADRPAGPFADSGRPLTREKFAIDAHPFEDDDGERYLFYATDFLEHTRIGTGTVCDRMIDPFTLEGRPRPVTRARFDWQLYDPQRVSKGGMRWHTVEGPFVLKRKDRYYEMFSGGNWRNASYGVGYAVADVIARDDEWDQAGDGDRVPPILRAIPGKVVGPGHNSAVRGPNNRELFCIYHRWTPEGSARMLCIDRMEWAGDRMLILGPSTTPQPIPLSPNVCRFLQSDGTGGDWSCSMGTWMFHDDMAVQESVDLMAEARCPVACPSFLMEIWLRGLENPMGTGSMGIGLSGEEKQGVRLLVSDGSLTVTWHGSAGSGEEMIALPRDFDMGALHLLRLEADSGRVRATLDGPAIQWEGRPGIETRELALLTQRMSASFAGFALTLGFEDLFMEKGEIALHGWEAPSVPSGGERPDLAAWRVADRELRYAGGEDAAEGEGRSVIVKGSFQESSELVVNARLCRPGGTGLVYGFYPAYGRTGPGPLIFLELKDDGAMVVAMGKEGAQSFALPERFDPLAHQQFRFRKENGRLAIYTEAGFLGELQVPIEPTRIGLVAERMPVAFDMVRRTAIESRRSGG